MEMLVTILRVDHNIVNINQFSPLRTCYIQRWKVEGELQRPKVRTVNSYNP